jgi:CHAD domain-containing protein
MEFSLRTDETLPEGLRRVVLGQLDTAAGGLQPRQADFDSGVHEARKAFKRIRAVLRLVRGELAPGAFKAENGCFRDAGRQLGAARDGLVLRLTLTDLAGAASDPGTTEYLSHLAQRPSGANAVELWQSDVIPGLRDTLVEARLRVNEWTLERDGFDAISPGLRRTYRQGRKRMRKAFKSGDERAYHAWRRRVKDLWHQLQLLQPGRAEMIGPLVSDLDALGEALGTDHDLAMARQSVTDDGGSGSDAHRDEALGMIDDWTAGLRDRSRELGVTIYQPGPDAFVKRIEACWRSNRLESDEDNGEPERELIEMQG